MLLISGGEQGEPLAAMGVAASAKATAPKGLAEEVKEGVLVRRSFSEGGGPASKTKKR